MASAPAARSCTSPHGHGRETLVLDPSPSIVHELGSPGVEFGVEVALLAEAQVGNEAAHRLGTHIGSRKQTVEQTVDMMMLLHEDIYRCVKTLS